MTDSDKKFNPESSKNSGKSSGKKTMKVIRRERAEILNDDENFQRERAEILNDDKNFHETIQNVIGVLTECNTLYVRESQLVEVEREVAGPDVGKLRIIALTPARLGALFSERGWLYKMKKVKDDFVCVPVRPPEVMKEVIPQRKFPGMRHLAGLQEAPYFYGGRFVNQPGYDEESGLLFIGEPMERPPVVGEVTEDHARLAAVFIEETLGVLEYEDDPRQGCWNIASITASLQTRWLHRIRPANLVTAPERGSGKTEATDLAIKAALGRESIAGIAFAGKEFVKELFSHAGGGTSYLLFDNLRDGAGFGDPALDAVITSGTIAGRPFNQNREIVERPANFVIVANGNNIQSSDDMTRRCLMTKLVKKIDTGGERFQDRFKERRKDFARACATVVAWHIQNGCPLPAGPALAPENFGDWAKVVRDAIWHASKLTGPPIDVMQGTKTMARHDGKAAAASETLLAFLKYWANTPLSQWEKFKRTPFTAGEVAEDLMDVELKDHVKQIAAILGKNANSIAIGVKLRQYEDQNATVDGQRFKLVKAGQRHGIQQWDFKEVD